jgi:hypothetical protein
VWGLGAQLAHAGGARLAAAVDDAQQGFFGLLGRALSISSRCHCSLKPGERGSAADPPSFKFCDQFPHTAQMEPFAKRPRVEGGEAIAAEDAITFHVLGKDRDGQVILEENSDFPPEMTHQ